MSFFLTSLKKNKITFCSFHTPDKKVCMIEFGYTKLFYYFCNVYIQHSFKDIQRLYVLCYAGIHLSLGLVTTKIYNASFIFTI